ncbi:16577_t:CDS:2, partial [Racocetra persica]
ELDKLDGIEVQLYPYVKLGNSTENLVKHLCKKHRINPKNYKKYLDDNNELIAIIDQPADSTNPDLPSLSPTQQWELTKLVVEFIVHDVQPLNILRNLSFHKLLNGFKPQYQIPYRKTVKKYISEAY